MTDDHKGGKPASEALYDLLERHLPQLSRLEQVMLGHDAPQETQAELWLKALMDDPGAATFVAQGRAQLFASLVIFLASRQKSTANGLTDERLEHGIEAAARFAGVSPAEIRKLLLPASLSFKRQ